MIYSVKGVPCSTLHVIMLVFNERHHYEGVVKVQEVLPLALHITSTISTSISSNYSVLVKNTIFHC